jgi:DNA-binding NarL/FixJ family response regulator
MIRIGLGSPWHAYRSALAAQLRHYPDLQVVSATADPWLLRELAANRGASVVVLDAVWLESSPDLIANLAAGPAAPRILLCADSLAGPEVRSAVQQGVQGCLCRDSPPETWHKAILALDAGEMWVPRWIMAEALGNLMQQLLPASHPAPPPALEPLTGRQLEIVHWVAYGLSNKEIARRLDISPMTVKTHLQNIFDRLGVKGRHELAVQSLRRA